METRTVIPETEINDIGIPSPPSPLVESPGSDTQRLISAIKYLAPGDLKVHPRNAEIYGNSQDEELQANINTNGVITPILATFEKVILSGHRRHRCAQLAGLEQVPVVFVDSTDEHDMIELLLSGNIQRKKSDATLHREIELMREIESIKARKRQATAIRGKVGGQILLPTDRPEEIGEVRTIVARKLEISERTVDESGKISARTSVLNERGQGDEAQALLENVRAQGIRATAMQVKELDKAEATSPENPPKPKPHKPKADKGGIIKRMQKDLARGLAGWPIPRLTAFAADLADFRKSWAEDHPGSPDEKANTATVAR